MTLTSSDRRDYQGSYGPSEPTPIGDTPSHFHPSYPCQSPLPPTISYASQPATHVYSKHSVSNYGDSDVHRREDVGSLGDQWYSTQASNSNLMPPPSAYDFNGTSNPYPILPCTSPPASVHLPGYHTHFNYPPTVIPQPPPLVSVPGFMPGSHMQDLLMSDPPSPRAIPLRENTQPTISINTFPTPSELLHEIQSSQATSPDSDSSGESSSTSSRNINHRRVPSGIQPTDLPSFNQPVARYVVLPLLCTLDHHLPSYFRDGISSHEKKRQLLECLEQYVLFLHEQLKLVGVEPIPLERATNARGLTSRSIRVGLDNCIPPFPG